MSTPWSRSIPNPHSNVSAGNSSTQPNLAPSPNFRITHGTVNGTTPSVTGVVAPAPTNTKEKINSIKTYFQSLS